MQEKTCLLALGSSLECSMHATRIRAQGTGSCSPLLPFAQFPCDPTSAAHAPGRAPDFVKIPADWKLLGRMLSTGTALQWVPFSFRRSHQTRAARSFLSPPSLLREGNTLQHPKRQPSPQQRVKTEGTPV